MFAVADRCRDPWSQHEKAGEREEQRDSDVESRRQGATHRRDHSTREESDMGQEDGDRRDRSYAIEGTYVGRSRRMAAHVHGRGARLLRPNDTTSR